MKKGFTLIELLIVISIIAVLSTIGITTFLGIQAKARDSIRKGDLHKLATALEIYFQQNNKYITNSDGTNMTTCQSDPSTSAFYSSAIKNNMSDGVVPPDPSSTSSSPKAYCYISSSISSSTGQGFSLFTHLEDCRGSGGNLCDYTNYNYSVVSDNVTTIASAPTDTHTPVNGGWSNWGACSVACGSGGNQTRTCSSPAPAYSGADCSNLDGGNNSRSCNTQACPDPFTLLANLLTNGGFESNLDGWSCSSNIGGTCDLDTTTAYSGRASARLSNPDSVVFRPRTYIKQEVYLSAGPHCLSGYLVGDGSLVTLTQSVNYSYPINTPGWYFVKIQINSANETVEVRIYNYQYGSPSGAATFRADNIRLVDGGCL